MGPEGIRQLRSEPLAEFHAPLIEGIYVPDDTLDEHLVLVECDDLAQRIGIEPLEQEQRTRMVTGVRLVRIAAWPGRITRRQRPSLGEAIGSRQIRLPLAPHPDCVR